MPSPSVDLSRLLRFAGQRRGEQSEGKGTNKPNGPELHNSLLYGYEGTNITGEKAVKDAKTLLIDALIESWQVNLGASYNNACSITLVRCRTR